MSELNNITIPSTPNSIPLNGSTARNPPNPTMLSKLRAQAGQAGANTETMIPVKEVEIPKASCLPMMKVLKATTIPPKMDVSINVIIAYGGKLVNVPLIKEKTSDREKSCTKSL